MKQKLNGGIVIVILFPSGFKTNVTLLHSIYSVVATEGLFVIIL